MDTAIEFFELRFPQESGRAGERSAAGPEDALVQAAATGDDEAFRLLVEKFQDRIYHFCLQWLGEPEDAQEACQDTFVRAYQAISRYRKRGKFTTWLYQIALNLCRDRHKSKANRQRRTTTSFDARRSDPACSRPGPDESASKSEDFTQLERGIAQLPGTLRSVVILRGLEGLNQAECAEILNCSERAVEGRFYRARTALADWWDREG